MKKRALALLISITLIVGVLAPPVQAETISLEGGWGTLALEGVFQFGDFYGEQKIPSFIQLFSLENTLVDLLKTAMLAEQPQIDVLALGIQNDTDGLNTIKSAFSTCINSNPELFNVTRSIGYAYNEQNIVSLLQITYVAGALARTAAFEAELQRMVQRALPGTQAATMTQTEKALALHDQLALEISYHQAAAGTNGSQNYPDAFNAYGAVIDKKAVCQGYALAYILLLRQVGISAMAVPSAALNHMWALVQITDMQTGSGWYHVDCTWDDTSYSTTPDGDQDWGGHVQHTYFMRTDAEELAHSPQRVWNAEVELPASAASPHPNKGFWDGVNAGMFYYDGVWTYLEGWSLSAPIMSYRGMLKKAAYGTARIPSDVISGAVSYATLPMRSGNRLYYYKFDGASAYTGDLYYYDLVYQEEQLQHSIAADRFVAELYAKDEGLIYTELDIGSRQLLAVQTLALTYTGPVAYGDINADGRISITDALLILNYKQNRTAFSVQQQRAADVDGDGRVSIQDAQMICDYLAGKQTGFPAAG